MIKKTQKIKTTPAELRWLNKIDKELSPPILHYNYYYDDFSGTYLAPDPVDTEFDDITIPKNIAVIVVNLCALDEEHTLDSIIAHEWRHHKQFFSIKNMLEKCTTWDEDYLKIENYTEQMNAYKKQIIKYFLNPLENDALRFENYVAKSFKNTERLSWVEQYLKTNLIDIH